MEVTTLSYGECGSVFVPSARSSACFRMSACWSATTGGNPEEVFTSDVELVGDVAGGGCWLAPMSKNWDILFSKREVGGRESR